MARAAQAALARQRFVSAIDVLLGLGWLAPSHVDQWRQGRVDSLEQVVQANLSKITAVMAALRRWARDRGSTRRRPITSLALGTAVGCGSASPARTPSSARIARIASPEPERAVARQSRRPDLVVIMPVNDWSCASCGGSGDLMFLEDAGPLCLDCADLGHLVFLPSGDAALTRRAKRASRLSAVVVRWSRARKRYERQGILVEAEALERAENECLADAEVRARRRERDEARRANEDLRLQAEFGAAIRTLFPNCPAGRAEAIARHAATRGSGRIGRSAAGRALDPEAVRLAVAASVRHIDTSFDELLMSGVDRETARHRVGEHVEEVLRDWRATSR